MTYLCQKRTCCARWSTVAQRPINIRPRGYLGHAEKELARDKMDGRLGRPIGSNYCHRSVSQYGNTLHPSIHPSIHWSRLPEWWTSSRCILNLTRHSLTSHLHSCVKKTILFRPLSSLLRLIRTVGRSVNFYLLLAKLTQYTPKVATPKRIMTSVHVYWQPTDWQVSTDLTPWKTSNSYNTLLRVIRSTSCFLRSVLFLLKHGLSTST